MNEVRQSREQDEICTFSGKLAQIFLTSMSGNNHITFVIQKQKLQDGYDFVRTRLNGET